jgi:hypothetical protein
MLALCALGQFGCLGETEDSVFTVRAFHVEHSPQGVLLNVPISPMIGKALFHVVALHGLSQFGHLGETEGAVLTVRVFRVELESPPEYSNPLAQ